VAWRLQSSTELSFGALEAFVCKFDQKGGKVLRENPRFGLPLEGSAPYDTPMMVCVFSHQARERPHGSVFLERGTFTNQSAKLACHNMDISFWRSFRAAP